MGNGFDGADDQLDDHLSKIYSAYINLQDMIKGLEKYDLSGVEAKQELCILAESIKNETLLKIVHDLQKSSSDIAVNQSEVVRACADDRTGRFVCQNKKIRIEESICKVEQSIAVPEPARTSITALNDRIPSAFNSVKPFIPIYQPLDHPRLSDNTLKKVKKIWELGKNKFPWQRQQHKFSPDIYASLKPGQQVVSEIINGYYDLIVKRSSTSGLPSVSVAKDYFLDLCMNAGVQEMPADINFDANILLFPMHRLNHWYTCFVDMRPELKSVACYDSLYSTNPRYEAQIIKELSCVAEFINYHLSSEGRARVEWQFDIIGNAPRQKNGVDCGVFTLKMSDYLATGAVPRFGQQDILYHRHQIVVELETGALTRKI